MSSAVAYNPDDPTQAAFLAAIAQGETGGATNSSTLGYGGANLAGLSTDQYGFPQWSGVGNTHAAGTYQFQPGTWDAIASKFGLNFQNPQDQAAGAWYEAQQVYASTTGGQSLETALQTGHYSEVQSALASTWTSVTGSGGLPQGLAGALSADGSAVTSGTTTAGGAASTSPATGLASLPIIGGAIGSVENFFIRGGLIFIGIILVAIALWKLLSNQGIVPSPSKVASSALV